MASGIVEEPGYHFHTPVTRVLGLTESTLVLLEQIRAGDQAALDLLLSRYRPLLTRWARGRLPHGVRDLSDTEDLVQELLVETTPPPLPTPGPERRVAGRGSR